MNTLIFKRYFSTIFAIAFTTINLVGCKSESEKFFSGRPSEMSMIHNQIIAGSPETMIELLRVPSRFPDANEVHISDWQNSIIAWWRHPEKHNLMISSFEKISRNEIHTLKVWIRVRDKNQTKENSMTLNEIEAILNQTQLPK